MSEATSETLWHGCSSKSIAARIAVGGDFLPAGDLRFSAGETWQQKAAALLPIFADVDTTFANLECVIGVDGLSARKLAGLGQTVSATPEALDFLKALRANAMGIANNHAFDFGERGVRRTRMWMRRAGIVPLGDCLTISHPPQVHIWQGPAQVRVGFWAAANATREPATWAKPGVEPATLARGREALDEMKRGGAQFRVALLHAGCLRTNRPEPEDVALMDQLASEGFDVVAASHSHRISGYKCVEGKAGDPKFCFYGLGSMVSGYVASAAEREGIIVVAGLDGDGQVARLEIRPVLLDDLGFGGVPSAGATTEILERFRGLSRELCDGSFERVFYDEVGVGLGRLYLRDLGATIRSGGFTGMLTKARRVRVRHLKRLAHALAGKMHEPVGERAALGSSHD